MHDFPVRHKHEIYDHDFDGCCRQCAQSVAMVKDHLLRFHQSIREYSEDDLASLSMPELYQLFLTLDDIAHLDVRDELAEQILADPDVLAALPELRRCYSSFFDLHEAALANAILLAQDPWAVLREYFLLPRYEALVQSQMEFTNDSKGRLGFIGCGPLPVTLILLYTRHGLPTVGIDVSPAAIELAGKVLARLGLNEHIALRLGDESSVADEQCANILVAALAEPKDRIFSSLRTNLYSKEAMVLYRTYTGMRAVLHPPIPAGCTAGFVETMRSTPSGRVNNTLVCLRPE